MDGDAQVFVLYKDIRAPGQYEDFYRAAQEDPGIFFTKGEVVSVNEAGDGNLVSVGLSDELLSLVDCVVIGTDHSCYDYADIANKASLVFDSRGATTELTNSNIVRL